VVGEGCGEGDRVVAGAVVAGVDGAGVRLGVAAVVAVGDEVPALAVPDGDVVDDPGGAVVTPGVPPSTPSPLSKPPPHEENATSSATTAPTAIRP
jgi:hypothetical protein